MEALKKITNNCRHATFLIEKKLIGRLTMREKLFLRIHLFGCGICRLYQSQTQKINTMIRQLLRSSASQDTKLDEKFKKELQELIEDELKKN